MNEEVTHGEVETKGVEEKRREKGLMKETKVSH